MGDANRRMPFTRGLASAAGGYNTAAVHIRKSVICLEEYPGIGLELEAATPLRSARSPSKTTIERRFKAVR
jgi:hypothetical protein